MGRLDHQAFKVGYRLTSELLASDDQALGILIVLRMIYEKLVLTNEAFSTPHYRIVPSQTVYTSRLGAFFRKEPYIFSPCIRL